MLGQWFNDPLSFVFHDDENTTSSIGFFFVQSSHLAGPVGFTPLRNAEPSSSEISQACLPDERDLDVAVAIYHSFAGFAEKVT